MMEFFRLEGEVPRGTVDQIEVFLGSIGLDHLGVARHPEYALIDNIMSVEDPVNYRHFVVYNNLLDVRRAKITFGHAQEIFSFALSPVRLPQIGGQSTRSKKARELLGERRVSPVEFGLVEAEFEGQPAVKIGSLYSSLHEPAGINPNTTTITNSNYERLCGFSHSLLNRIKEKQV